MTIRFLGKTRGPNDGTRTLEESTLAPELVVALKDWYIASPGVVKNYTKTITEDLN